MTVTAGLSAEVDALPWVLAASAGVEAGADAEACLVLAVEATIGVPPPDDPPQPDKTTIANPTAPAQRNDTFTLADMYQIYTNKKPAAPGVLNGGETRELIQALKAEDMKRRVEEAKRLIHEK